MAFLISTRPAKVLFLYTFLRKDDENEKESNYINPCCSHYSSSILAGMSIVDVSRLLGHKNLGTTMEYITANAQSVKDGHNNFVI